MAPAIVARIMIARDHTIGGETALRQRHSSREHLLAASQLGGKQEYDQPRHKASLTRPWEGELAQPHPYAAPRDQ